MHLIISRYQLVYLFVPSTDRFILQGDPNYSYPVVPETVPNWLLYILVVPGPICIVLLVLFVELMKRRAHGVSGTFIKDFLFELHSFLLSLAFTFVLLTLIVQTLKVHVGYYRPNVREEKRRPALFLFFSPLKVFCDWCCSWSC